MHVQPYIRIDVMLHSLAPNQWQFRLCGQKESFLHLLRVYSFFFFHSTMRYISLVGSELLSSVLALHSHVLDISGNFGISYRRSHRRFLCTFQWIRSATHCGPAKYFLLRCLLSGFFNYRKVKCTFILEANYEN